VELAAGWLTDEESRPASRTVGSATYGATRQPSTAATAVSDDVEPCRPERTSPDQCTQLQLHAALKSKLHGTSFFVASLLRLRYILVDTSDMPGFLVTCQRHPR